MVFGRRSAAICRAGGRFLGGVRVVGAVEWPLGGLWAAFGRRPAVSWAVAGWRAACGWCLVLLDGLLVCIGRRVAGLVRSGVASGAVSVLLMGGSPVFG